MLFNLFLTILERNVPIDGQASISIFWESVSQSRKLVAYIDDGDCI